MHTTTRSPAQPCVVGQNIDTFIGNARVNGDFPAELAAQLEEFKGRSQEAVQRGVKKAQDIIATWSVELGSITQALDDALRLLEDPQGLYEALPEGLKLVLVQTVFEKIWILDTAVAGCELTEPFAEILTVEAKRKMEDEDGEPIYYRRRESILSPSYITSSWERPFIERPHGALAIDGMSCISLAVGISNIEHLAGVRGFKLNPVLRSWLLEHFNGWRADLPKAG